MVLVPIAIEESPTIPTITSADPSAVSRMLQGTFSSPRVLYHCTLPAEFSLITIPVSEMLDPVIAVPSISALKSGWSSRAPAAEMSKFLTALAELKTIPQTEPVRARFDPLPHNDAGSIWLNDSWYLKKWFTVNFKDMSRFRTRISLFGEEIPVTLIWSTRAGPVLK